MSEAIIVALITGACAIGAQIASSAKLTKELYAKLDKQTELSDERLRGEILLVKAEIEDLRKTVEKHNNMIERTYKLEKAVAVQDEKINSLTERIGA